MEKNFKDDNDDDDDIRSLIVYGEKDGQRIVIIRKFTSAENWHFADGINIL